jgi:excisionase family DNA binding protein
MRTTTDMQSQSELLLYDLTAAQHLTCLGRSQLYKAMDAGELGSIKVGRRRLIPREALVAYVEGLKAGSSSLESEAS